MANILDRNTDFLTNGTVTSAGLHNLIDDTNIYAGLISTQAEKTTVGTADLVLVADSSSIGSPQIAANRTTVYNLFEDALTGGTYANAQLSGNLTYGTATGNRTISTGANITNGTISTLIAGTTTSTAAAITNGTITNGTITTALIPTLTAGTTTGTAGIFTSGTVATLNSTTGTIGNLSTTLAGDFTISQGTGTLGTTGATLGTYGGATSVPVLAINAKGQVTSTGTAAITSGLTGFRNRIINGDMRIDQRNAGAAITTQGHPVDRFQVTWTMDGAVSCQRSTTAPSGYRNSLAISVTSQDTSIGASQFFQLIHKIEGNNISDLMLGTGNAGAMTLSFWVNSSKTGIYCCTFANGAANRLLPVQYTINNANTWEQKTITFSGDTSGTWLSDNGLGLYVIWNLALGSNFNAGTNNTWNTTQYGTANQVNFLDTNGATFYITGVQLEAGSSATDFERRPIGTELALCQRYYQKTYELGTAPATVTTVGAINYIATGSFQDLNDRLMVEMRGIPSTVQIFNPATGTAGEVRNYSNSTNYAATINSGAGQTSSKQTQFRTNVPATSANELTYHLTIDAEL